MPTSQFSGRIKYFTCPPENFSPTVHLGASIVGDLAKEFSLDDVDFQKKETEDIDKLPFVKPSSTVAIETMGFFQGDSEANIDLIETRMDCEDEEPKAVVISSMIY